MGPELSGVIVTPVTPFTPTLEIDEDAVRELTGYFLSVKGINGIICNAHAGEGSALTPEERIRNIHTVREEVKGRMPVMSMVEAYGAAEAIRLIHQAQDAGAEAIMLCPPPIYAWHARRSPDVAIAFWREICGAVDMPLIVFQYYTGSQHAYTHETLIQLVRENENIVGIKMAHGPDLARYAQDVEVLRTLDRQVAIMPASGRFLHVLSLIGADGAVTGYPNFVAEEIVALFEAAKTGESARVLEVESRFRPVARVIASDPFYYMHQRYKEATRLLGRIPNALVRSPCLPPPEEDREQLRRALAEMGRLEAAAV